MAHFFKMCKPRFSLREESFTTRHDGKTPQERGNNELMPETNKGKRKEIPHLQP
jgi:hypothetical protein